MSQWTKKRPKINKPCIVLCRYDNMDEKTTTTIIFDVLKDSKGLYVIDAQGYISSLDDIHKEFDWYCVIDYPERSKT